MKQIEVKLHKMFLRGIGHLKVNKHMPKWVYLPSRSGEKDIYILFVNVLRLEKKERERENHPNMKVAVKDSFL